VRHVDSDRALLWTAFHAVVNMTSPDLRRWLEVAPEDQDEYLYEPDVDMLELGVSVLHLINKRRVDLTAHDLDTMRQVVDLGTAWLASPREGERDNGRWRHSLMCVGHDPLKGDSPHGPDATALRP
jgi:uncharacterized protein DUF3140